MIELLLCTLIWGASFIAQKLGADHFGPFAINCYRNLMAGVFLFLCLKIRDRRRAARAHERSAVQPAGKGDLLGGALSGLCVVAAEVAQQIGIESTSPGVSAFLTANYVLLVPVFGIVLGRRAGWGVWGGVALAILGTFLICLPSADLAASGFRLGRGEAWTLLCAALFAVQILVVDRFAPNCDMLRFSMVQMSVAGLVALPFVFLPSEVDRASWAGFVKGIPALVWLGVVSSGIAYTLQNFGQARTPPALAAILLSTESVFGALSGYVVLGDALSARQFCGCALVFAAAVLTSLLSALAPKCAGEAKDARSPRSSGCPLRQFCHRLWQN